VRIYVYKRFVILALQNKADISRVNEAMNANHALMRRLGEAGDIKKLQGRWSCFCRYKYFTFATYLLHIIAILLTVFTRWLVFEVNMLLRYA